MMILVQSKKKVQRVDWLKASGVGGVVRRLGLVLAMLLALIGVSFASAAGVAPVAAPTVFPSPNEIVAAAPAGDWVAIAATDLLVMDLAPDVKARPRRVVIQLMPPPFSQGWIGNIRKLAAAHFWDGTSVNRVQDNYVVQWGDASEKKALPVGLVTVGESDYITPVHYFDGVDSTGKGFDRIEPPFQLPLNIFEFGDQLDPLVGDGNGVSRKPGGSGFSNGWPVAYLTSTQRASGKPRHVADMWPIHCYAMVGVGRNLSPDTGTGAELYTVIGHAPRHLDRNIALVGRVIEGIEHLSSLPRGTGALGFYETAEERLAIRSVRIASEMETDKPLPRYEYLSTESASFAKYADARANRRDPFFIKPAGGADICNIPVPVRRVG
jgi:cyclophilin family peptidyl-prolyl cis-trans isomerase